MWAIVKYRSRLSLREAFEGFKLRSQPTPLAFEKLSPQDKCLYELSQQSVKGEISDADLEELVKVAEVMLF
jgi:hypothetical protein